MYLRTAIIQRLHALCQARRSPPARNANSNGDPLDHRLSVIGYRLSAIGYRLSVIAYFSTSLQDRTSTTTLSTCGVCGKMSTGVARSTV